MMARSGCCRCCSVMRGAAGSRAGAAECSARRRGARRRQSGNQRAGCQVWSGWQQRGSKQGSGVCSGQSCHGCAAVVAPTAAHPHRSLGWGGGRLSAAAAALLSHVQVGCGCYCCCWNVLLGRGRCGWQPGAAPAAHALPHAAAKRWLAAGGRCDAAQGASLAPPQPRSRLHLLAQRGNLRHERRLAVAQLLEPLLQRRPLLNVLACGRWQGVRGRGGMGCGVPAVAVGVAAGRAGR